MFVCCMIVLRLVCFCYVWGCVKLCVCWWSVCMCAIVLLVDCVSHCAFIMFGNLLSTVLAMLLMFCYCCCDSSLAFVDGRSSCDVLCCVCLLWVCVCLFGLFHCVWCLALFCICVVLFLILVSRWWLSICLCFCVFDLLYWFCVLNVAATFKNSWFETLNAI